MEQTNIESATELARKIVYKRKRASAPKVKSGCVTCKKRRLKCDEEKPKCKRCTNFGTDCEGYEPKLPKSSLPTRVTVRPLAPHFPSLVAIQPLCRTPSNSWFRNGQEYRYFQQFRNQTAGQLAGCFEPDSELWDRVVLQASEADQFIRHGVIAIGALNIKPPGANDKALERVQHDFAYREYDRAILGLRRAIAEGRASVRTKLIACILFACFETYHGNIDFATAQIYAGIEMINQYFRLRSEPQPTLSTILPTPIDDRILEVYAVLEIQAASYNDPRSKDTHLQLMRRGWIVLENLPVRFTSFQEARLSLAVIMLTGMHWRLSQQNDIDVRIPPLIQLEPCKVDPEYDQLCTLLSGYHRWSDAFSPLVETARISSGSHLSKPASLVRIQWLGSFLWLATAAPETHMYYRQYTRELKEIVALARVLTEWETLVENSFSLDIRIVLPLAIVGLNYRYRAVRREIMDIFSRIPRREGVWDAVMIAKIMKWISELEEDGLGDEEYVPEDLAARLVILEPDKVGKTTRVGCVQPVKEVPGKTILRETTIAW